MGKPKKAAEELRIKYVNLIFKCTNGHRIAKKVEIVQGPGTSKILDSIPFPLRCPECNWEGELLGSRRIEVIPVEASGKIH
jgi:hypothetical protein